MIFVATSGCTWRRLPPAFGPARPTVYRRFARENRDRLRPGLHRVMLDELGVHGEQDLSRCSIDSVGLRTYEVPGTGLSPTDRGKPGSNIHLITDRNGLPLSFGISAAGVDDSQAFPDGVGQEEKADRLPGNRYRYPMIGSDRLAAFVAVVAALIAVPGPSVLFVVSRGVALGRRAAVFTAIGNEAGLLVQVLLVAFGLGQILERSLLVFSILKFVGALYLVYLGVQAWRQRRLLAVHVKAASGVGKHGRILREGFVVGLSNPKGLLIFGAVLPQFVDPRADDVHVQLLLLGLICVAFALVSDTTWGLFAGSARTWLARSPRRLSWIGGASGAVMVGLGIRLALDGRD